MRADLKLISASPLSLRHVYTKKVSVRHLAGLHPVLGLAEGSASHALRFFGVVVVVVVVVDNSDVYLVQISTK